MLTFFMAQAVVILLLLLVVDHLDHKEQSVLSTLRMILKARLPAHVKGSPRKRDLQ